MLVFNECRITDDGKCLIIEVSVENNDYYENVFIDRIILDTDETFLESGPSGGTNGKYGIKEYPIEGEKKNVRLKIPIKELTKVNSNSILFIYAISKGTPSPHVPCGADNTIIMTVAVNLRPIYNKAMSYIKELNDTCSTPKGFIDMILVIKAFKLALRTGHYKMAIKFWNKLHKKGIKTNTKNCGCIGYS